MHTHILPIGPQHPALEEAIYFKIHAEGEEIRDIEINLGYEHKGVEKSFENRSWYQNVFLASRICGICNHEHSSAYIQGVEKLMGIKVPKRALYIRTILSELERIQSHLLWAGIAAHEIGFETLFQYCWREREYSMDLVELVCGKRVHYDVNSIGGVRRNITDKMYPIFEEKIGLIEEGLKHYKKVFVQDPTVKARTKGVGILKRERAEELSAVGPTARASNVNYDMRKIDPYQAYGDMDFKVILDTTEDVRARTVVRILEMEQSISILRQALEKMPKGKFKGQSPFSQVPAGEATSRVEAPRGELFYYLNSKGMQKPYRVKVRTPTYANFASIREMVIGETIADAPIIIASIDPCVSCCDRMEVFDISKEKSKIYTTHELTNMKEVHHD